MRNRSLKQIYILTLRDKPTEAPYSYFEWFGWPMFTDSSMKISICILVLVVATANDGVAQTSPTFTTPTPDLEAVSPPTDFGRPAGLPRPSEMAVNAFEQHLYDFVNTRQYVSLGWIRDKQVRDTGPFLNGKYYGTHPAVRVYYSPEMMQWLVDGRKSVIPDGAMIIKEQFQPPAARSDGMNEDQLWEALESWTIMVKDSQGSHDGWFWSNPAKNQKMVDYTKYPFEEPYSGFGLYCVRCHGSTKSPSTTNEFTFASLRNIAGFPGEPMLFRVDDSWRESVHKEVANEAQLADVLEKRPDDTLDDVALEIKEGVSKPLDTTRNSHPRCADSDYPTQCIPELNSAFVKLFPNVTRCDRVDLLHIPPVTYDSVPRQAVDANAPPTAEHQAFITSNQCMNCHSGITEPFGPTMFIPTGTSAGYGEPGLHISPYGEWRWTPMGLAGRDPVFFAQLESEMAILEREYDAEKAGLVASQLQKTCLGCHGVMGKRQHDLDSGLDSGDAITIEDVYRHESNPQSAEFADSKYGALARDGVSCVACHRMQPRPQPEGETRPYLQHFLETSITGNFVLGKPDELYGPYKDDELAPYPMQHSIGFKPKHSEFIKQSQMCGTCHTVNLPVVDWNKEPGESHNDLMLAESNPAFQDFHHHVEQATYLEWLNSEFENELNPSNEKGKSCQDCHMSRGVHDQPSGVDIDRIETRIATIQDTTYPDAENLAAHKDLTVRPRKDYARHNFRGLNVFMLEMFNQFDDVLGVRKHDYMTGSKTDIPQAVNDFMRQAKDETATIGVEARWNASGQLVAEVDIHSQVGHRFPSGVGFRRAFIELLVIDDSKPLTQQIVWSSGRTNEVGLILDQQGKPLVTEFFQSDAQGSQLYQPHHEVITSSEQVQIYETLLHTRSGKFTTSFIHGCTTIKDNRFLPRGWRKQGPGPELAGHFLTATYPGPVASRDARYQDGSGSDLTTYRVSLPTLVDRNSLRVQATLYYQAIPPYFLKNIFDSSPNGPATQRLHYICSNLKLEGTPIQDWKLPVVSATTKPIQSN